MIRLSLIQTSRDRAFDLEYFVDTLNKQQDLDFSEIQLIFVDQGNLRSCFNRLNPDIDFLYLKTTPCSLSHARNIGLKEVKGEYVCFPDDDCWLDDHTIIRVLRKLEQGYNGVIIPATNEEGKPLGVYPKQETLISEYNHCNACSITLFLRYYIDVKFDENLGVGSKLKLSAGEETDYVIETFRRCGGNIIFDINNVIHHPIGKATSFGDYHLKKYYYGRGIGYLLRKQKYPMVIVLKHFIRPLLGMIIYFFKLDKRRAKLSYYFLKGKVEGFREYAKFNK